MTDEPKIEIRTVPVVGADRLQAASDRAQAELDALLTSEAQEAIDTRYQEFEDQWIYGKDGDA